MPLTTNEEYTNWPAIEGRDAANHLLAIAEDDGFALDSDTAREHIIRERNHWVKVFDNADDMGAFSDAYNEVVYSKTNFAL